mmetsp:Transcript_30735/g.27186  ORF Transcript_30735/g.27186 Transcript_30735/m.27186 type:complete len:84 (-) Transcript_30735:342-593(-)
MDKLPFVSKYGSFKDYQYNLYVGRYIPWESGKGECTQQGALRLAKEAREFSEYVNSSYYVFYYMAKGGCIFLIFSVLILMFIS